MSFTAAINHRSNHALFIDYTFPSFNGYYRRTPTGNYKSPSSISILISSPFQSLCLMVTCKFFVLLFYYYLPWFISASTNVELEALLACTQPRRNPLLLVSFFFCCLLFFHLLFLLAWTSIPTSHRALLACTSYAASQEILKRYNKISCLVISAGMMALKGRDVTSEGAALLCSMEVYPWPTTPLIRAKEAGEEVKTMSVLLGGRGGEIDMEDLGLKKIFSSSKAASTSSTYNDLLLAVIIFLSHSTILLTHQTLDTVLCMRLSTPSFLSFMPTPASFAPL